MRLNVSEFFVRCLACIFAVFWVSSIWASQEKVCGNERALFHCAVSGDKDMAMCPRYVGGELAGVQYQFGRKGKKELVYPESGFDFKAFRSNHFVRYQVDYKSIKFAIGSYTYSLYSNYDGESVDGVAKSAGVVISNSSGVQDVQVPCEKIYVDELEQVIPRVECDANDAMGCR